MSLINDVLRELEARRSEGNEAGRSRKRSPITPGHRSPRRWPWWLVAAIVTGAALHLMVQDSTPASVQPALQASISSRLTSATADMAQGSTQESNIEISRIEVASEPLPAPSSDIATSTPDDLVDNGVPENELALMRTGTPVAHTVTTNDSDTDPAPTTTSSEPDSPPSTIVIERADRDSDAIDDPYLAARRSLARGRRALAESQLRELIDSQPDHARGRHLLAMLLLERQRRTAAVALLENGLNRADPARAASLLGRLLADQGDVVRARQVLLKHAPAIEVDPDYHLLLAAIERQNGDHQAAHDRYLALTVTHPDRPTAWIGLGTSLESLNQPQAARAAYLEALNGRDRQAAAFARDRLNAIPEITGEGQ